MHGRGEWQGPKVCVWAGGSVCCCPDERKGAHLDRLHAARCSGCYTIQASNRWKPHCTPLRSRKISSIVSTLFSQFLCSPLAPHIAHMMGTGGGQSLGGFCLNQKPKNAKMGTWRNRTVDLSHPKRESYH